MATVATPHARRTVLLGSVGLASLFLFPAVLSAATVGFDLFESNVHEGPLPDVKSTCIAHLGANFTGEYVWDSHDGDYECRCYSNPGGACSFANPLCPIGYQGLRFKYCHYHAGSDAPLCGPKLDSLGRRVCDRMSWYPDPLKNAGTPSCRLSGRLSEGNPINIATGNKYLSESDYFSAAPAGLQFVRLYNSNPQYIAHNNGDAWSHSYSSRIQVTDPNSGLLSAEVTRPDGRVLRFSLLDGSWTTDPDVKSTISELTDASGNRTGWQYATEDRKVEAYDADGRLVSITDESGFVLTLTYDVDGRLEAVADSFGRSFTFTHDAAGKLLTMTDPAGGVYSYGYDTDGNLESVAYPDDTPSDPADNPTRLYHYEDPNFPHALTGITDANGDRFATWTYDSEGRAISSEHAGGAARVDVVYNADGTTTVTDAQGATRTYTFQTMHGLVKTSSVSGPCSSCGSQTQATTYDANGFIASKTDFNGNVTTYQHNDRGLQTSRTEASGTPEARTISTIWHPNFRLPTTIAQAGQSTELTYDSVGRLLSRTVTDTASGDTRTTTFTYYRAAAGDDPELEGLLKSVDGPRTAVSDVTTYGYDSQGNRNSITNALGHVTQITAHDPHGRPLTVVDANGTITQFEYDARGRLRSGTTAGDTTSFEYDAVGNVVKMTLPTGAGLDYTYDAAHRLTAVADSLGNRVEYTLDAMGNRLRVDTKDSTGTLRRTMSHTYNSLSRLISDVGGEGQTTAFAYDANGNVIEGTDPRNNVTTHAFDSLDRLISSEDAADGVTGYTYDARDNLLSVTDPRGLTTTYAYDGLDNRVQQDSPDTGITTYDHDPAGNVTSETDARGVTVGYLYDVLNRLTGIDYPDDGLDVTFVYDNCVAGIGRLCTMLDGSGSTQYQYDSHGNVVVQTVTIGTVSRTIEYSYDESNHVVEITHPSGRSVEYSRDTLGRVSRVSLTSADGFTTQVLADNLTYAPFGPMTAMDYGNGIHLDRSYDLDYRLSAHAAGTLQDFVLTYDPNDNITAFADNVDPGRSQSFSYDALNRLIAATGAYGSLTYGYDAVGNRQAFTENGDTETYSYAPDSNRLLQRVNGSTLAYSYDANGNTVSNSDYGFIYSDHNRMTSLTVASVPVAEYTYNGKGERVAKEAQTTTLYFYDLDGRLIEETNDQGNTLKAYVYLGGVPLAMIDGQNAVLYVHTDHLGTPRIITDSNTVIWRWESDAFGTTAAQEDPDGDLTGFTYNLRFPGQYFDVETGLHYNYFRTYDPRTGRYLESDPIGLHGGLNTYGYGLQNPNSYVDSTGLDIEVLVGGPYGDTGYGHVALRVYGNGGGDCGCESYDNTYDFGRYGKQWGTGGSEGEGMLRVWSNFSRYISSQNTYGRTTTGYVYSTTSAQDAAIIGYYGQLTQGLSPNVIRGDFMKQYRLPSDYNAANNNCTTQAFDGLGAGAPGLRNLLNGNQFDKGRGLTMAQKLGYRLAKDGNGVRMPLDLGAAAEASGGYDARNQYGN